MTDRVPFQMHLGIALNDAATFDNFYIADDSHSHVLFALRALANKTEKHNTLIWGASGCGLTHLAQAACREANDNGLSSQYLPLNELLGYSPEDICDGMEELDLLCLDGIDLICGSEMWELALFHLINRVRDKNHTVLFCSHTSPPSLPVLLPDLKSRLLGAMVYHIESLSDKGKERAMIIRAQSRGFDLSTEVARYIIHRASRDTNELFYLLDRLDDASLRAQRRLTIPFVKEVLGL